MAQRSVPRLMMLMASPWLALAVAVSTTGLALASLQLPGTALTSDRANDLRPAWSPDGALIAFQSARSGNNDIWVMNADGSDQHALTDDPADDRRPAWSPDGAWIVFDSNRGGSRDIWVMDAQGRNPRQLTASPNQDTFPAWSPDGLRIAYYSYGGGVAELWVVPLQDFLTGGAAGEPHRLVASIADERQNQCTFACHMPGWSPDGTLITFPVMNNTQIWVVGADGSNPRRVTAGGLIEHFPVWQPDGRILFLSERITDQQDHVNDVLVMDADGQNAAVIFAGVPHGGPLEFRPDGVTIAFQSPRSGNFDIYTTVLGQGPVAVDVPEGGFENSAIVPTAVATTAPGAEPPSTTAPVATAAAPPGLNLGLIAALGVAAVGGGAVLLFLFRRGRP